MTCVHFSRNGIPLQLTTPLRIYSKATMRHEIGNEIIIFVRKLTSCNSIRLQTPHHNDHTLGLSPGWQKFTPSENQFLAADFVGNRRKVQRIIVFFALSSQPKHSDNQLQSKHTWSSKETSIASVEKWSLYATTPILESHHGNRFR